MGGSLLSIPNELLVEINEWIADYVERQKSNPTEASAFIRFPRSCCVAFEPQPV
jgi:hypothetical protein